MPKVERKVVEKRISVNLPPGWEAEINKLAQMHNRTQHGEMINAIGQYIESESKKVSNSENKPCVIAVGFPNFQEMKEGQEFLKGLFNWVHGETKGKNAPETICASPKSGLSYDEAFIIVNRKFPESGWVYAESVGLRTNDPQPRFMKQSDDTES
jgi:hypothetical protein